MCPGVRPAGIHGVSAVNGDQCVTPGREGRPEARPGTVGFETVPLPALVAVGMVSAGCGSDDGAGPVRPVRLPPTTISEGEPPSEIQEQPRPVEPLSPPSEQP